MVQLLGQKLGDGAQVVAKGFEGSICECVYGVFVSVQPQRYLRSGQTLKKAKLDDDALVVREACDAGNEGTDRFFLCSHLAWRCHVTT